MLRTGWARPMEEASGPKIAKKEATEAFFTAKARFMFVRLQKKAVELLELSLGL